MIIGVDTRIPTKNRTGIGYVLSGIIPLLIETDRNNKYKLLGSSLGINSTIVKFFSLPKIIQRAFNFMWKYVYFPPVNIIMGNIDVFFFTNFLFFLS